MDGIADLGLFSGDAVHQVCYRAPLLFWPFAPLFTFPLPMTPTYERVESWRRWENPLQTAQLVTKKNASEVASFGRLPKLLSLICKDQFFKRDVFCKGHF